MFTQADQKAIKYIPEGCREIYDFNNFFSLQGICINLVTSNGRFENGRKNRPIPANSGHYESRFERQLKGLRSGQTITTKLSRWTTSS